MSLWLVPLVVLMAVIVLVPVLWAVVSVFVMAWQAIFSDVRALRRRL